MGADVSTDGHPSSCASNPASLPGPAISAPDSTQESYEVILHVRFCAGGRGPPVTAVPAAIRDRRRPPDFVLFWCKEPFATRKRSGF